jgi:hypothetical protein
VIGNGSQKSGKQFSLGVYAELSVDGSKVISDGARAQEHRMGDVGRALAGNHSSHNLGLASRELAPMGESSEGWKGIQGLHCPRFECGLAHMLIELASRAVEREGGRARAYNDAEPRRLVLAEAKYYAVAVCPAVAPCSHPGNRCDCEVVGCGSGGGGQEFRCCRRMYESDERKAPELRATCTE